MYVHVYVHKYVLVLYSALELEFGRTLYFIPYTSIFNSLFTTLPIWVLKLLLIRLG